MADIINWIASLETSEFLLIGLLLLLFTEIITHKSVRKPPII